MAILANYVKFNKVPDKRMLSLPKHYQSMLNYGKLCINISELDSTAVLSINFQGAMKLIER